MTPLDPVAMLDGEQWRTLLIVATIGLCGGIMGGLAGIGGSLLMIPALTLVFGRDQHLYQAAAMVVNFLVATTATIRHARARSVRRDWFLRMVPWAVAFVVVGVLTSDRLEQLWLQRSFGAFMIYVAFSEAWSLWRRHVETRAERTGAVALGLVGSVTGFVSGMLGVGGGGIAVPLLRGACHAPLRAAIGTSSAVMLVGTFVGSILKNVGFVRIDPTGRGLSAPMAMALVLAPLGILGAWIGASLTHRLNIATIRVAFALLMLAGGLRMILG